MMIFRPPLFCLVLVVIIQTAVGEYSIFAGFEDLLSRSQPSRSLGVEEGRELFEAHHFKFKVSKHNKAEVEYVDQNNRIQIYSELEHNPFSHNMGLNSGRSVHYWQKSGETIISLVIHSEEYATLTVLNHDEQIMTHISPVHHNRNLAANSRHILASEPLDINFWDKFDSGENCDLVDSSTDDISLRRPRNLVAAPFENCYPPEQGPRILEVGIITDLGFYHSLDSDVDAVEAVADVIIAMTNTIYYFQLNILLRLAQLIIVTEAAQGVNSCPSSISGMNFERILSQSRVDDTCCGEIKPILDRFSDSVAEFTIRNTVDPVVIATANNFPDLDRTPRLAFWTLISDCYRPDCGSSSCIDGIAYHFPQQIRKGGLCRTGSGQNIAIVSRSYQLWLTYAHELGHGLGSSHSFENGIGFTGGIMDYGDKKFKGQYQFNTLRKQEICNDLDIAISSRACITNSPATDFFPRMNGPECNDDATTCTFQKEDPGIRPSQLPAIPGLCRDNVCLPVQILLTIIVDLNSTLDVFDSTELTALGMEVIDDTLQQEMLIETAEFAPIGPTSDGVEGEFYLVNGTGCTEYAESMAGRILLVQRGECRFTAKAAIAENAGALGIVVVNNKGGPPAQIGGAGYSDLPTIGISRADGEVIRTLAEFVSVEASIAPRPASLLDFPEISETLWSTYYTFFITFLSVAPSLSTIYLLIRYRDRVKARAEDVVDATIEARYKVEEVVQRGSMRLFNSVNVSNLNGSFMLRASFAGTNRNASVDALRT